MLPAFLAGIMLGIRRCSIYGRRQLVAEMRRKVPTMFRGLLWILIFSVGNLVFSADTPPAGGSPAGDVAGTSLRAPGLSRWLDLQTGSLTFRYKWAEDNGVKIPISQVQYNLLCRLRVKFDSKGRYSLIAAGGSGNRFNSGWNATGIGEGRLVTNLYLKQLYVSASPIEGIEVQYGGFGFVRGESTDITSFNLNGYLMGERLTLKRPGQLFFDEISLTGGYIGDFFQPGVIDRFHQLSQMNYRQFLVGKNLHNRIGFSADYTFQQGTETLREAIKLKFGHIRFLDAFLFENYQRVNVNPAWGYSIQVQKSLLSKLNLAGGVADIDQYYGPWNSERYGGGHRVFLMWSFPLCREFVVGGFVTQVFATDFPVVNHSRFEVGISYDFAKRLKRAGLF
jgi:hypothetical protein